MTLSHDHGLSTSEAERRLESLGPNDVEERNLGRFKKFLLPLVSPISLMLLGAAFLSRWNGRAFDCYFILALYATNYLVEKWQEFKADRAISVLRSKLSFKVSTLRDGAWGYVEARDLVPGDYVRLGLGSIIPADARITEAEHLSVNEAVLTGESLPKEKLVGETLFSGSFITTGSVEAEVTATGSRTSFGKTIFSIDRPTGSSLLERDVLSITRFLTFTSLASVCILTAVFLLRGYGVRDLLTLDLSLIIAGVPVALPAVMAIILSIGAAGLAKKSVIVRRLSALEDLSNVDVLLTDKTGTLTNNKISVTSLVPYGPEGSAERLINLAASAVAPGTPDAIDLAILKKQSDIGPLALHTERFVPYDSERKRSTSLVSFAGETFLVSMGAPQIIGGLTAFSSVEEKSRFEADVAQAAENGYRALAVAFRRGDGEERALTLSGLLLLSDPLDPTSSETLAFLEQNGVETKMVTGDNLAIARRIASELGLGGAVIGADDARRLCKEGRIEELEAASVFAEVLPEDKLELVKAFQARHSVASTGDGVNDMPAIKTANVGIAVAGAVSALKSLSDLVLLGPGVAVIKDALIESRKIFVRLYNYSVYRISESFRLIITVLVLGVAYGSYPLVPIQLLLLTFLNDIPIITLAFDRVKTPRTPATVRARERLGLSLLFGSVGILNSLLFFFITTRFLRLPLADIQTMFFLKLTVSGHMLIFVAHTKERWYKFLPARSIMIATFATQILATGLSLSGLLMPARISPVEAAAVWLWAFFWMQVSEIMKDVQARVTSSLAARHA